VHSLVAAACIASAVLAFDSGRRVSASELASSAWVLIGIGDSLTHGTMDAFNNALNTWNAYLQRVRNSLVHAMPVVFSQPFFDENGDRAVPFHVPTNVAVDGEDSFSIEGLDYYKRAGTPESVLSDGLLADKLLPSQLEDTHDKVLFPINLLAGEPVSQMDSAEWLLTQGLPAAGLNRSLVVYWVGNNDSSTSALGFGGANPTFMPLPADQLTPVLPLLSTLLKLGEAQGILSLQPYTAGAIDRNLTSIADFYAQQLHLMTRLALASGGLDHHIFVLTLPYYSSVGYLMDSEDLEYYFRKIDPAYTVPPSFARVAPPGQPITDPTKGDRISLLTFGLMYALLDSGLSASFVNGVLEKNGQQQDGLVLAEAEQAQIMARIDAFNATLKSLASSNVHIVDIGSHLNDVLLGRTPLVIGGRQISRKWMRGSAFSFDGVHPGYTGHALISNAVVASINQKLGTGAPLTSLPAVFETDPYVDRDNDGFAAGPNYTPSGMGEILFLFKDPDDTNPAVQPDIPDNVWELIVRALLEDLFRQAPALRPEAQRLGLIGGN
jgi:hypothetical protein